jgi:hypothetical protein
LITRDVAKLNPNNIYALIDFFIEMLPQIPNPTKPVLSTSCAVSMQMSTWENPKKTIGGGCSTC